MSTAFYEIYHEDLKDIPDEVLYQTAAICRRTCRFFPTIAEIREKAEPLLQEWSEKNRKMLVSNEASKCEGNVFYQDNYPYCKLETDAGKCKLAGTGMCKKWDTRWRGR